MIYSVILYLSMWQGSQQWQESSRRLAKNSDHVKRWGHKKQCELNYKYHIRQLTNIQGLKFNFQAIFTRVAFHHRFLVGSYCKFN